jgi:hypothetical protein
MRAVSQFRVPLSSDGLETVPWIFRTGADLPLFNLTGATISGVWKFSPNDPLPLASFSTAAGTIRIVDGPNSRIEIDVTPAQMLAALGGLERTEVLMSLQITLFGETVARTSGKVKIPIERGLM